MRTLLILCCLALPLWAGPTGPQPAAPKVPSQDQLQQLRGVLNRYAQRAVQQGEILGRMRALVTPEQETVIRQLRITPEQSVQLVQVLQEVLPQVAIAPDLGRLAQALQAQGGPGADAVAAGPGGRP